MVLTDEKQVLTVEEAGRVLGLGRSASYDAVRRGDIPSIRIGHRLVVPTRALERLLETGTSQEVDRQPVAKSDVGL